MWRMLRAVSPRSCVYLPEQHSQQQEDEDSHQQTDGDDPADDVTPRLLTVESLEHQLKHNNASVSHAQAQHTHTYARSGKHKAIL